MKWFSFERNDMNEQVYQNNDLGQMFRYRWASFSTGPTVSKVEGEKKGLGHHSTHLILSPMGSWTGLWKLGLILPAWEHWNILHSGSVLSNAWPHPQCTQGLSRWNRVRYIHFTPLTDSTYIRGTLVALLGQLSILSALLALASSVHQLLGSEPSVLWK